VLLLLKTQTTTIIIITITTTTARCTAQARATIQLLTILSTAQDQAIIRSYVIQSMGLVRVTIRLSVPAMVVTVAIVAAMGHALNEKRLLRHLPSEG
jgi:hypothetical protein